MDDVTVTASMTDRLLLDVLPLLRLVAEEGGCDIVALRFMGDAEDCCSNVSTQLPVVFSFDGE